MLLPFFSPLLWLVSLKLMLPPQPSQETPVLNLPVPVRECRLYSQVIFKGYSRAPATAPDGPHPLDVTKLIYLAAIRPSVRTQPLPADASEEDKAVALVADIVRQVVVEECYPELYRTEHGYVGGWGFESLLGAMYL
jgi:hypothetical protein